MKGVISSFALCWGKGRKGQLRCGDKNMHSGEIRMTVMLMKGHINLRINPDIGVKG